MKKYIIILLILLFPMTGHSFETSLSYKATFPNSDALSTTGGLEFEASHEGYLVWVGYEKTMIRMVGQEMADIDMWSAGLGYRLKILEKLSIAIKGGFYKPIPSYRGTYQEAIYRQMHAYIEGVEGEIWRENGIDYDEMTSTYDINSGWGGEIQANWTIPLFSRLDLNLMAGYRYLILKDRIAADINGLGPEHDDLSETGSPYHEFLQQRNWCGGLLSIMFTWSF